MQTAAIKPIMFQGPSGQEDMPYLLTPGPLTTTRTVKQAMLADYGSRDPEFRWIVRDIRQRLLAIAQCGDDYECVLMQGAGTFAMEAAIGSLCPEAAGKTLVLSNGAYGERADAILQKLKRPRIKIDKGDQASPSVADAATVLDADASFSHLWMVHCETTSGIVNPLEDITRLAAQRRRIVMVDAMSSFGAIPINVPALGIDVLVSSSNKCIEGVPGFSYVIVRRRLLESSRGKSHSVVLDLFEQWKALEADGQFRFTPPTHALVAFHQALKEHEAQGGVTARGQRYARNTAVLVRGMREIGFTTLLNDDKIGPIIQTFLLPRDPQFNFEQFYEALKLRGFAIYPGKLTKRPSFRVGTIGAVDEKVMLRFLEAMRGVIADLGLHDLRPLEG